MNLQNAEALLSYAQSAGIKLAVQDDELLVDAPIGSLSPDLKRCLVQHKQSLIFLLSHHGFSQNELKREAQEDWQNIKNAPKALYALANALYKQRLREQEYIPPSYTSSTTCLNCGLVPIPPELKGNGKILFCPWCWNKAQGLSIPKIN